MVQKLILLAVIAVIVPYLVGNGFTYFYKQNKDSAILSLVSGYMAMWGIFQVMVLPAIYYKCSLSWFVQLYLGVLGLLSLISLLVNRRRTYQVMLRTLKRSVKHSWILWVAGILIIFQAYYVSQYQHIDDDDAFYVATAESATATDTMMQIDPYTGEYYEIMPARYVLSPFPIFVAVVSRIVQVKPVVMAHMIFPAILLPLAYLIYYLLAGIFFQKSETKGFFMILIQAVMIFSGYSVYTQGTFLAVRSWQGKAVLASILIPAVLYYMMRIWKNRGWMEYVMLLLLMLSCCMVSSMGIMLGAMAVGILSLAYLWENKKLIPVLLMWLCCIPNAVCAAVYIMIR